MLRRSSLRLPVRAFVFGSGIGLWVACSSDSTDFFGPPLAAAGKGAQAGAGATSGGSAGSGAGHGGSTAATGGAHTGGSTGGSDPSAGSGNASGGAPDAGAPSSGGTGGKGGTGGTGVGGSGLVSGTGGEGGDIGSAGTQAGDGGAPGGSAGEPGVGGTAGTGGTAGGAGTGGTSGAGMGGMAGTVGGAGMAGSGGQPPVTCGGDPECAPTEYCKKASCEAAKGTCTVRPTSCTSGADATFAPVCGCDKMTYYTACVAAREGVNVASSGQCAMGAPCTRSGGSGDSCMPHRNRAACYRTRPSCAGTAPNDGVCWVLPDVCPQEDAAHLYCNQGGTPECHGLCDALESKYPLVMNSNQCN